MSRNYRSRIKTLRPKVAVRLLGICLFGCLTGFLVFDSPYWMAGIWTGLITAGLFYGTVRFVVHSEQKLTSFLQALSQNDFTVTFPENTKSDDYDLHTAFNKLNEKYKKLRSEKESQHQLLQVVVEHAGVPLLCFEEGNGETYLINEAAKKIFSVPFLQHVSSLARVDRMLPAFVSEIKDGAKETLKLVLQGRTVFLSCTSTHIRFQERNLKLVAFHDVSSELAAKEADTWQKLLRVLTHEISNSAIPLSTLSAYIYELVTTADAEGRRLSTEERADVLDSLKAIDQRSKSLKQFVENFRNVNRIPEPELQRIPVFTLMEEVHKLFSKQLEKENIDFQMATSPEPVYVYADPNLTMQVLINLMKNAVESMSNYKEGKSIVLSTSNGGPYVDLHIRDTGCGIAGEELEQIFIPFFTTKKGGSGIGLSISQQIMQKQRGDISLQSQPGKGSVFTVSFSC